MALTATKYRTVMVIKVGLFNFWLLAYNYNTFGLKYMSDMLLRIDYCEALQPRL